MKHLYSKFINEFMGVQLAIPAHELLAYLPGIQKILKGEEVHFDPLPQLSLQGYSKNAGLFDYDETGADQEHDTVAIIPLHGALTKFGNWWSYGADDYANMLMEAYQDDSIKSIVLDFHTPGGSTDALFNMKAAIQRRNKPVIAVVNNKCFSAGLYLASFCDEIIAIDNFAEVGSIGIMATIFSDKKMLEGFGLIIKEIIPPESKWKNKAYNEALKGNDKILIEEQLSPFAMHFQEVIKTNRPKLNQDIEGIIEGKTFYAVDAITYGLIDKVTPMLDAYQYALDIANDDYQNIKKTISTILK